MVVHALVVMNTTGAARLTKFYTPVPPAAQQAFVRAAHALIARRPDGVCNIIPSVAGGGGGGGPNGAGGGGGVDWASCLRTADAAAGTNGSSGGSGGFGGADRGGAASPQSTAGSLAGAAASVAGGPPLAGADEGLRLIYRQYATLFFVAAVDETESPLGILDLLQVLVETLDKCFENVCELDLIFHMDKVRSGAGMGGAGRVGGEVEGPTHSSG